MLDLKKASTGVGFMVEARQCSFESVWRHVCQPRCYAIAFVQAGGRGHFVAVVGSVPEERVRAVDLARGIHDIGEDELCGDYGWQGEVLLLRARD